MELRQRKGEKKWSEVNAAAALYCISALFTSLPACLSATLLLGAEELVHTVFISEQLLLVAALLPCPAVLDVLDGSLSFYLHICHSRTRA